MDIEAIKTIIERTPGLENNIGMEFISTPDEDSCMAQMHVDERNTQPFGFLSGGASLALAETLAGVGSVALCPDKLCMGMNVNASHLHPAKSGETVTATARIIHRGMQTHVWQVEIRNEHDEIVSAVTVTNFILAKREK